MSKQRQIGYKVSHHERKIIITKKFEKWASVYGTEEYSLLLNLSKDYPEYEVTRKIINKNDNKENHNGLTFKQMETYIQKLPDNEELLKQFERVKDYHKDTPAYYAKVKKWFFEKEILKQYNEYTPDGVSA